MKLKDDKIIGSYSEKLKKNSSPLLIILKHVTSINSTCIHNNDVFEQYVVFTQNIRGILTLKHLNILNIHTLDNI